MYLYDLYIFTCTCVHFCFLFSILANKYIYARDLRTRFLHRQSFHTETISNTRCTRYNRGENFYRLSQYIYMYTLYKYKYYVPWCGNSTFGLPRRIYIFGDVFRLFSFSYFVLVHFPLPLLRLAPLNVLKVDIIFVFEWSSK